MQDKGVTLRRDLGAIKALYEGEWADRMSALVTAGVPMAVDRREEARTAWTQAVDAMEDLQIQIDRLSPETPDEVVDELQARFADAETEAHRQRENLDRLERIYQAREQFGDPVEGDADSGDGEGEAAPARRTPARQPAAAPARRSTGAPRVSIGREAHTYERYGGNQYFRDLMHARLDGNFQARDRLERHNREMLVEGRALSSTDGAGGEFIPPLWMMDEWTNVIRMGRQFANAVNQRPLPEGTDVISIPRLSTGAAVAAQADAGAVQNTDPTTSSFSVPVKTAAGEVTLSRQLLDRSNPAMDDIIFADLTADYNLRIDLQCLVGSGSGANAKGVMSDSNRISVTYTDASPTVAELYSKVADAVQQVSTQRGLPPNLIVMHPRRWAWVTAASDSAGRPLVVPAGASQNAPGESSAITQLGPVGSFYGLPVIIDANLPTNQGTGTNEDVILVLRTDDVWLMEDAPIKTRVDESRASANLQVVLQLWNYFAFTTERYSKSIASIGGTGLVAPTF